MSGSSKTGCILKLQEIHKNVVSWNMWAAVFTGYLPLTFSSMTNGCKENRQKRENKDNDIYNMDIVLWLCTPSIAQMIISIYRTNLNQMSYVKVIHAYNITSKSENFDR